MKIRKTKAAILANRRDPLIVDEIELPETLNVGQALVKVHYTTICSAHNSTRSPPPNGPAQIPATPAGHEASGTVDRDRTRCQQCRAWRYCRAALATKFGIQCMPPSYKWRGNKLNAGWVTTFNEYAVISERQ